MIRMREDLLNRLNSLKPYLNEKQIKELGDELKELDHRETVLFETIEKNNTSKFVKEFGGKSDKDLRYVLGEYTIAEDEGQKYLDAYDALSEMLRQLEEIVKINSRNAAEKHAGEMIKQASTIAKMTDDKFLQQKVNEINENVNKTRKPIHLGPKQPMFDKSKKMLPSIGELLKNLISSLIDLIKRCIQAICRKASELTHMCQGKQAKVSPQKKRGTEEQFKDYEDNNRKPSRRPKIS